MKVIKPHEINVLSTTVPENDAPAWATGTTYTERDKVLYEHRVYQSLKNANTGKKPSDNMVGAEAWWADTGASNAWRMFDEALSTQTTVTGEGVQTITFSLKLNDASGFALLNLTGVHVAASITEEGETAPYWSREYELLSPVPDWWEWLFEDQSFARDRVATDIPPAKRCTLTVTVTGATTVGIGHFTHGKQREVGASLYGFSASLRSYSKKETDDFGNTRLVRRRSAKRHTGELYAHPRNADTVFDLLTELENIPALWIGDNRDSENGGHQSLTAYGWVEDFNEVFAGPNEVQISITIQGLA